MLNTKRARARRTGDKTPPQVLEPIAEALPAPAAAVTAAPSGKTAAIIGLLKQDGGVSLEALMQATGWQAHSVRGVIAGALKKKLQLAVISQRVDGVRIYSLANDGPADAG